MALNRNHGRDQNIAQNGGVFNIQNVPSESVLQKLSSHASFSALYDSELRGQRTGVHEGTREGFLERLGKWIEDPDGKSRVFWIRGGAGVGKSAVAQTICEKYASIQLAASHFFSRNDNSRNSLDHFIPTLAYQLAESHGPDSRLTSAINDILNANPRIMDISWEEQFKHLICSPCAAVNPELWTNLPRLIVIDGLDECMDRDPQTNEIDQNPGKREGQRRLLSMIRNATSAQSPLPLHFLIFSRPEYDISTSFRSHPFIPPLEEFDMRELRAQADSDIELYLRDEFACLIELHPHMGFDKSWPGEDAIHKLIFDADGHFVYVVTAVKYIASYDPILLLPQDRLAVVLHTSETSLYPNLSTLDKLYQHILQPFMGLREHILLPILQLIISPHMFAPPGPIFHLGNGLRCRSQHAIAKLLKLDSRQVSAILSRLHSILNVPNNNYHEDVSVLHTSFSDFLINKHRSLHFHVEPLGNHAYFGMLSQCLLPVLNDMTRRYAAGERMPLEITNLELYSIDIWLFVEAVFNGPENTSQGMMLDRYTPSEELLHAINEFNMYHYISMLFDWEYMEQIYTVFPNIMDDSQTMDVIAVVVFANVPCIGRLYSQCAESTSGPLLSYTDQFCSKLRPFTNNHRSLFKDGWLAMLPRTCMSSTLSQLALLIIVICNPILFAAQDYCLPLLKLRRHTDNCKSHVSFKIFPRSTDLVNVPEGSHVQYISGEKGRIFADRMQKLGRNLGGHFYSKAAGERGIRAFMAVQFTGLDEWNSEISMLLDLWPSQEEYGNNSDRNYSDDPDWSFDNEDVVASEFAAPNMKLEDLEDILDYVREFPWRLKAPRRPRLGSVQSELSPEEPNQTNNEERSEFHMARQNPETEEETPSQSSEVLIKESGSKQAQSSVLEGEDPLRQDAYRSPDASEIRLPKDEGQRATDTERVQAAQPTVTPGWMRYLW